MPPKGFAFIGAAWHAAFTSSPILLTENALLRGTFMFEELEKQFRVSRVAGLLRAVCVRCGNFVGASPSEQQLRIALTAHNCKDAAGRVPAAEAASKSGWRK